MILYLEAEAEALSKHTINWQGTVHLIHFEFAHGHGYIRANCICKKKIFFSRNFFLLFSLRVNYFDDIILRKFEKKCSGQICG